MKIKPWMLPFLLALGGVITDFATTTIALNFCTGLYETHPNYNPIYALTIFWTAIAALTLTLPKNKPWTLSINGIALASYIGTINNTLVILGLCYGLVI
ncbi:MAG: hypothetical protein QXZ70_06730 [Candidatus Bathyarchaeia archaeon]